MRLESLKESVKNANFNWEEFRVSDIIWLIEQAEKVEKYEKALNECIRQDGLMDFLDKNSWACQEDYFIHIGKEALYSK